MPPPAESVTGSGGVAAPTDRVAKRYLERLPKNAWIRKAGEAGVLGADEQVVVCLPMFKLSPSFGLLIFVGLLPAIIFAIFVQRTSYLYVTNRRVVVTSFGRSAKKMLQSVLSLDRPVHLALAQDPRPSHYFGNKVTLPPDIASFLGKPTVYAQLGTVADYAFRVARTPAAG
jgi:hypothetical protein